MTEREMIILEREIDAMFAKLMNADRGHLEDCSGYEDPEESIDCRCFDCED